MKNLDHNKIRAFRLSGLILMAVLCLMPLSRSSVAADEDHGYLGVALKGLDDETRESLKFKDSGGVLVEEVMEDGPAAKAGIKDGDIIIRFNDKAVKDEGGLRELILATKPEDKVAVAVFRDGERKTINVVMGEPSEMMAPMPMHMSMKAKPRVMMMKGGGCCCEGGEERHCGWLGVQPQNLSEQLAAYFKVKDGEGVLVASVEDGSPAQKAGIKAGDVIVKVGDEEVDRRAELQRLICEKKPGDEVTLEIVRDGKSQTLKATLAEAPEGMMHGAPMMGRAFGWYGKGESDFDLEELGPELERELKGMHIELDQPMEDLQKQIEDLRQELDKLKTEMEHK